MDVNFFWRGHNFSYLNRLCVITHIKVGHKAIVWLSGNTPISKYWISDLKEVEIRNADEIIDVTSFLNKGGNLKTASSLWRFRFLYDCGGLYCDTDALAINFFPNDDWIISASIPKKNLSTGVIKCPPKQKVFLNCIKNIKKSWGNVDVFTNQYKKHFGNTDLTHDHKLFYPFNWREAHKLFDNTAIPDVYSVHLYHTILERDKEVRDKEEYRRGTMLGRIIKKFDP